jgi:hypothetical protein
VARDAPQPKIGAGHAEAMFRQGLAELRAAAGFSESNVAQPPQYGLYGTKTPGEVAEARKADERDLNEEPRSVVDEHVKQAEEASRDVHERDSREPEKE